ncbi:protein-methionine-sulfoxide reductase heme-binding subunit MsrQ [Paracoccus sp. MBLB3053]|uniref:Protein-methionine-sulfoxide reductase heme-binding subunit MsrQ n=1 Tax=Paracoccus aurantius TaxID=3073814 RepID=A0ABU2HPB3_9RHOB|nr:protein-methionine-sulfoxide reductase heme-binding subunit MsrQ [Paracoccus sp. MBLB3053]MDS9466885.1 protein-methionine-sulfoxide reductase heme-binding subunit MsrQ [Paracoccus sp. MBLB3053]
MIQRLNRWSRQLPVWAVWLVGAVPLGLLIWDTLQGNLGVDPVRDIEHRLGRTALYFLIATLAVTPLLRLTRINLVRLRQALGLICFSYAVLHLSSWIVFDMAFLWAQMLKDVVKRPYLIFGMIAFAMLLLLAVTSNRFSMRRMRQTWKTLHRLIYPAAILVALHWLWALKLWETKPLAIFASILLLLALRLPFLARRRRGPVTSPRGPGGRNAGLGRNPGR